MQCLQLQTSGAMRKPCSLFTFPCSPGPASKRPASLPCGSFSDAHAMCFPGHPCTLIVQVPLSVIFECISSIPGGWFCLLACLFWPLADNFLAQRLLLPRGLRVFHTSETVGFSGASHPSLYPHGLAWSHAQGRL